MALEGSHARKRRLQSSVDGPTPEQTDARPGSDAFVIRRKKKRESKWQESESSPHDDWGVAHLPATSQSRGIGEHFDFAWDYIEQISEF